MHLSPYSLKVIGTSLCAPTFLHAVSVGGGGDCPQRAMFPASM